MKIEKMKEKVNKAIEIGKVNGVNSYFSISDDSVQAELRLSLGWSIFYPVDQIRCKKAVGDAKTDLWSKFRSIGRDIDEVSNFSHISEHLSEKASAKTKAGSARREELTNQFWNEKAKVFLSELKKAQGKRAKAKVQKAVADLQSQQKELLKLMRAENSRVFAERKAEKAVRVKQNEEAFKSGEFWKADKQAIKDYFNPPFSKNYLADVSEKWRAALFTECESTGWKDYNKNWRHKLVGTGRAYLCGIDDNGDEWGHEVRIDQSLSEYGDLELDGTVEQAMRELFELPYSVDFNECYRQGDLFFQPIVIDIEEIDLHEQKGPWNVRESHDIESNGMLRNGEHFKSSNPITVSHTSHEPVILPPGEYKLYTLDIVDAD